MALGALNALERQGMNVPAWVSLVGFDDTVSAYSRPQMTTVACSKEDTGRHAVLRFLERLNGDGGGGPPP
jgi:DNA-binding LacI/PurR family transcriptional regulator